MSITYIRFRDCLQCRSHANKLMVCDSERRKHTTIKTEPNYVTRIKNAVLHFDNTTPPNSKKDIDLLLNCIFDVIGSENKNGLEIEH